MCRGGRGPARSAHPDVVTRDRGRGGLGESREDARRPVRARIPAPYGTWWRLRVGSAYSQVWFDEEAVAEEVAAFLRAGGYDASVEGIPIGR